MGPSSKAEHYLRPAEECIALAKVATSNKLRAHQYATADRYLAIGLFARLSHGVLPRKTAGPIKADLHAEKKSRTA